jgi:hypothetical protein
MGGNLRNLSERSPEEVKAITSAGGIASGKARRYKRDMRELANEVLNTIITDDELATKLRAAGVQDTYGGLLIFKAIQEAQKSPAMFEKIMTLAGYSMESAKQAPEQKVPEGLKLEFVSYDRSRLSPEDRKTMEQLEAKCRQVRSADEWKR